MTDFTREEGKGILVEFAPRPGMQQIASFDVTTGRLEELSRKALDSALSTIGQMARRVIALRDEIPAEFTQVDVEFGIKLDAEVGSLIAKAGGEAAISVKLTWERRLTENLADET